MLILRPAALAALCYNVLYLIHCVKTGQGRAARGALPLILASAAAFITSI